MKSLALMLTLIFPFGDLVGQEDQQVEIEQALAKLEPLIGTWTTVWHFHRGDEIIDRVGADSIAVVLGRSYLNWQIERHPREDPARSQSSIVLTTFDPYLHQYVMRHFYQGSSLYVTATGKYDEPSHQLRTKAFIPREDGIRDENVRAIIDLSNRDRIVYTHYSRFNDESMERKDLEIILTRVR